jgi:class 3 adenylate cyclase/tetratricopeptide (TPR) repeat protein
MASIGRSLAIAARAPGPVPDVETISVLITDLVGSTDLAARVGPVADDELRHEHFDVLRQAIHACHGEEVKTTGDGLMVVFRAAANAVNCAVSIQQGIEHRNRLADEPLGIRIGIALGDATLDDGDYFGTPVVEAVRLCKHADGGQILATELVRVVGGRDGHEFRPVGALDLHGLPEPVAAVEVAWEPSSEWSGELPLPPRLLAPSGAYVARVDEGELVRLRWLATRRGERQSVMVAGEQGIGKTCLVSHCAREFYAGGAVVMFGHCPEEVGAPYAAWIEALSHFIEHAPDSALAEHVERHGGELMRLVPTLAGRVDRVPAPARTDPETERYLLFSAVVGLLEGAAMTWPLVLVLDDLHRADGPTLALLKHVITETRSARLLVLGTYRDSELARDHPLTDVLAALWREQGIERLGLRGFDEAAVVARMELAAGHEMDASGLALARQITAETDGNPFFVGELLTHLTESGAWVAGADGHWELRRSLNELGLPRSLHEVVDRRVTVLGDDCREVLTCAAVIGREFDLELLQRVVGHSEDALIDLLDAAVTASLLEEDPERAGSFSFAHNLINHTLYDALGAARRSRLHRRVANALEELCGGQPGSRIAELARHWTAATVPIEPAKAVAYSRQAGERALAELAPDEAIRWFEQAIELLDRLPGEDWVERCDLSIALGEAQRQAGRPAFRQTLLHAAQTAVGHRDADRSASAALANSRGFASEFGSVDAERVELLERAIDLNEGADPSRRARLRALQAMELQFDSDHQRRRRLADTALTLARESGDLHMLPYVLRDHFHAVWCADTLPARRATAEEMTELANRGNDPLARIWALDRTVHAAAEGGSLAVADDASRRLLALTQELGQPRLRWHATYYAAGLAQLRGDLDDAERLADEALALAERDGEPDGYVVYYGQIAALRSEQGRGEEVVDLLEGAVAAFPGIPAFEAGRAAILSDTGRASEAARLLEQGASQDFADMPRDQVWSTALCTWARVAAEVRFERAAAALYDLLEPCRGLLVWNGATGYGAIDCYLGMLAATLGWHERAAGHHDAATEQHRREGVTGWEARNLCWRARSLLACGHADGARAAAAQALELARAGGLASSRRKAEELLDTAGRAESP